MSKTRVTRRGFLAGSAMAGLAVGSGGETLSAAATTESGPKKERMAAERRVGGTSGLQARSRLYLTAADLPALRARFESDTLLQKARAGLLARAENALTMELTDESYAADGQGQHGNYYAADAVASASIETCAFAYLVTGDKRFAQRAREGLRHFARYQAWTGREFGRRDPPWHSALETAHFTRAFALGIDWLGDALDADERRAACDALARLGVEPTVRDWLDPDRRIHALDSMGHNWWMVCVGAAGLGALTLLGEDKRAEDWLRLAVDGVPEFFRYPGNVLQNKPRSFDPQGGFYESLSYADYTLRYYAYLADALQHVFPRGWEGRRFDALPPELNGMFEFMLYFLYPRRRNDAPADEAKDFLTVAFGDDGRRTAFSGDSTLFLARATGDGRYRWYFDQYSGRPSGFYQMLFYDPAKMPAPKSPYDLPLARALHGIGWASLRDSWDDNAAFLAIKCGDTWNHAHADAASFVVYAGGEPLLIDPGTCSYSRPEYRRYYTESVAHNTVLVDGKGQPGVDGQRGVKFPGKLYSFLDSPDARYVLADATGPFAHLCKRFLRHFLWLDDVIIVVDDLLAHQAGRFEWLFHGDAPPRFENGRMTIEVGSARLDMDVLFPKNLEAEERKGPAPRSPDRALNYLALRQREAAGDTKFFAVIRAGRQLPPLAISAREGSEWIGAQWKGKDRQWDVYCNLRADGRRMHVNSNQRMEQWETDAFLLGVRTGAARRLVLIGGSYLRTADGEVVFDCLSKCNAVLVQGGKPDQVAEVFVQAPEGSKVRVKSSVAPSRAVMNGRPLSPDSIAKRGELVIVG